MSSLCAPQGLGKTFQVAAFLAGAFAGGAVNRALVVAPTTLLAQWEKCVHALVVARFWHAHSRVASLAYFGRELGACGMGARVHVYSGGGRAAALRCLHRTGGVLLTSYGMVLHNARALGGRQVTAEGGEGGWECEAGGASSDLEGDPQAPRLRWDWVVCDEGHKLKNPNMQLVARLSSLAAQRRLILTGTPVQNNLGELWALANFVAPGLLGDARTFRESYEKPVSRGTSRDASARERHVGAATAAALRAKLAPAFLRRDKRDVFQQHPGGDAASGGADAAAAAQGSAAAAPLALGRKTDMIVWLRLTPPQRRLYAAFLGSSSVAAALNKTRSALAGAWPCPLRSLCARSLPAQPSPCSRRYATTRGFCRSVQLPRLRAGALWPRWKTAAPLHRWSVARLAHARRAGRVRARGLWTQQPPASPSSCSPLCRPPRLAATARSSSPSRAPCWTASRRQRRRRDIACAASTGVCPRPNAHAWCLSSRRTPPSRSSCSPPPWAGWASR